MKPRSDTKYTGEVIIKYSKARATVTPAPCGEYGKGHYLLRFDGDEASYVCVADDFEPTQEDLFHV